jgi:methionyl aminopeptidase
MVICIEPMVNAGGREVYLDENGWAVRTADGKKSAHFELMVAIRKGAPEILSTFEFIETN